MSQDAYTCQQCKQPLILDPSVTNITAEETAQLLSKLPPHTTSDHIPISEKLAQLKTSKESKRAYVSAVGSDLGSGSFEREKSFPNNTGESFVLLGGSISSPKVSATKVTSSSTSAQGHKTNDTPSPHHLPTALLETLSSRTAIDHPLCSECARILQETLQAKLEDLTKERDAYIGFEKDWNERVKAKTRTSGKEKEKQVDGKNQGGGRQPPLDPEEYEELLRQKRQLEVDNERLLRELLEAEEEEKRLEEEEKLLAQEEAELEQEEIDFLQAYQEAKENDKLIRQQLSTEKTHLLLASQTLTKLESTNVYNDIFQIGHVPLLPPSGTIPSSGSGARTNAQQLKRAAADVIAVTMGTGQTVGTINGLRLGGRPWVEWVEINAALGLVALCIDRMAVKVGCTFHTYKILPLGSFSRVDELPPSKNSYELYASTDISAARFLQNRRFNYALVGMLDCLRQLVEHQRERSRGWGGSGLDIQKDRIAGHSIKLNANMGMSSIGLGGSAASTEAEESWTKALRAVLAVLKRILVIESEADREDDQS